MPTYLNTHKSKNNQSINYILSSLTLKLGIHIINKLSIRTTVTYKDYTLKSEAHEL